MRRLWLTLGIVLMAAAAASAQSAQVSVTAATHVLTGDDYRIGSQERFEPDLGVSWQRAATFGGSLGLDLNVTRRHDALRLGRGVLSLRGARFGGLTWDLTGGDSGAQPFVPDFGFANLRAPIMTFAGGSAAASNERLSIRVAGGRSTQSRNFFGTDFLHLKQTTAQADIAYRLSDRVRVSARGSHVANGDLGPYATFVDWSRDVGAGVEVSAKPWWQMSADLGVSHFLRRGADDADTAPSWLVGTKVSGERGRLEVNAQRFSVGRFAAMNYPFNDRQGVYVGGEWRVSSPLRVFGSVDTYRTNLDPDAAAAASVAMPEGVQTRAIGGARIALFRGSVFTVRAEGGGRELRASKFTPGFESDTGALAVEWQTQLRRTSLSARYEHRTNVDNTLTGSSFGQHEWSSQAFVTLPRQAQLFLQGYLIRRTAGPDAGETEWQGGGGVQAPVSTFSFRLEGTFGRTTDWVTGTTANRQMLVAGVSGQIARRLTVSADVVMQHAPLPVADTRPWFTRSIVRVTRTMSYGRALAPMAGGLLPLTGPMGSLASSVFVDWNGNGVREADEEPAPDVMLSVVQVGRTATSRTGEAVFSRVPVGNRLVSLDLESVAADYDLPEEAAREVTVEKGKRTQVAFGLIPVGTIAGVVRIDRNKDGVINDGDEPLDGAVVVLDGVRAEVTREGAFRFDNVRLGPHAVALDLSSLEMRTAAVGPTLIEVELTRAGRDAVASFLVQLEARPEQRRVFPPKRLVAPEPPVTPGVGLKPAHQSPQ